MCGADLSDLEEEERESRKKSTESSPAAKGVPREKSRQ
jgi:hypothetical protein